MNSILAFTLGAVMVALAVATPVDSDFSNGVNFLTTEQGEQCSKELSLTEEEIAIVKAKDLRNGSDNIKCFLNCYFDKVGGLKNGVIQHELVLKRLSAMIGEEKASKLLAKCEGIKGVNNCDTAYQLYECFHGIKKAEKAA